LNNRRFRFDDVRTATPRIRVPAAHAGPESVGAVADNPSTYEGVEAIVVIVLGHEVSIWAIQPQH